MKKTFPLIMLSLFFSALGFTQSAEEDDAVIFVTATKIGKPVAEQRLTITEEEIEKSNAENLTGLLQRKGMQILSYGAYGLEAKPSIRGFTDETVRVVIDGICVNNAQYVAIATAQLPADFRTSVFRAEYKMQSKLGDVIYPVIETTDEGYIVVLNDEAGEAKLVCEFIR